MNSFGRTILIGVLCALGPAGCLGPVTPPEPRSIIIYSGERLQTDVDRMAEVERVLRPQLEHIETSPAFMIMLVNESAMRYPWDSLELEGDTARIGIHSTSPDVETPYLVYAHLRIEQDRGTLGDWLEDAADDLDGFDAERAILERVSDIWLLGRSIFDTQAYGPMDELLYSNEFGYLDDFILATQGERFPDELERYREEEPTRAAEFAEWFQSTFERDGPGYLPDPEADEAPDDDVQNDVEPDS